MTTVLLIRHGRTSANASGVLAGWTPGVVLDDVGVAQAETLGRRLASVPLAAIVSSPLERTMQTARLLLEPRNGVVPLHEDEALAEVRYGDWTGRELKSLAKEPLWRVVQAHPSAAHFPGPGGEALSGMAARAVGAIRRWNAHVGSEATYAVVSHGDVIKAIVADALGLHLDQFQRIQVDPCSLTVIRYTDLRPFVLRVNDIGGGVEGLIPPKGRRKRSRGSDAAVGGGAGT
jgi:probable phosphomutase (TIGR03848 family)